jgi:hypothetical protein
MSELRAFCNQLVAFFEDLSETYPEESDIAQAAQALKLMKQANPRLVHTFFMEHVYNEFAQKIMEEDEDYILKRAQLIQLLNMNELPQSLIIEKMTVGQLREEARRKGVRGFWTLRREQLVELLFPSENLSDDMNKV